MAESASDSDCSETSKLSLSLSFESSSFKEELDTVLEKPTVTPYQFKPYLSASTESDSDHHSTPNDEENPDENRLNNTDWYY